MKQNRSKIIGLTGGISTGKSTVTLLLREKGFVVIDADVISREIMNIGKPAYEQVIKTFGMEILNSDSTINRPKLGEIIFADEKLRHKLNSITHPYIINSIKDEILDYNNEEILFLDIPLLIEIYDDLKRSEIEIDEIWLVYCSKETQINRLMKRDDISLDSAKLKVEAQIDIEEKRKLADKIIDNTKSKAKLIENIDVILGKI